jgi:hypothetical protein
MAAVSNSRSTPVTSRSTLPQEDRRASVGDIAPVYRSRGIASLSFMAPSAVLAGLALTGTLPGSTCVNRPRARRNARGYGLAGTVGDSTVFQHALARASRCSCTEPEGGPAGRPASPLAASALLAVPPGRHLTSLSSLHDPCAAADFPMSVPRASLGRDSARPLVGRATNPQSPIVSADSPRRTDAQASAR